MKIKFRSDDQSSTEFILNIVIIIAAIILLFTFIYAVSSMLYTKAVRFNDDDMSTNILEKDYSMVVETYYSNYIGKDTSESNLVFLAKYTEAAYMHAISDRCNDKEEASVQMDRMNAAEAKLGKYSSEVSKIDSIIEKTCYKNE